MKIVRGGEALSYLFHRSPAGETCKEIR